MDKKKLVFISHPFANNPTENRKKVDLICKYLIKHDIVPISPLHLFMFYENDTDRGEIMLVCKHLIDICDELWAFGDSKGCKEEMQYAQHKGKHIELCYEEINYKFLMEEVKDIEVSKCL